MLELYNAKGEHIGALAQVVNQHCCRTLSDGDETLDFEVPRGSTHETAIETEGYVRTKRQEYVVKKTDRTTSNTMTKVEASLNIETLEGTPFVGGFVTIEKTLAECMEAALVDTGWRCSVEDAITKRRTVRIEQDTTVWEIVKDAISTYRVEVRIETLEKCLYFVERRGGKKGAYFYERINLRSLGVTASSYGFYTKLIPKGKDGLGLWVDGKDYIENYQHSTKQITRVWRDNRYTNTTSLYEDALARLEEASRPVMAFTGELINLAKQSKKYSVLDYDLGDTVLLASSTVGVWVMQRIVKLDEYEQHPEDNTAEFSNVQETFAQLQKKGDELSKKEAIEAANRTMTETLKDGYFTKTETTTAIAAMEEKILLEVGSSEEQWEEYMDGRLASYPTKTEMNSAIELSAQNVELSVTQKMGDYATTADVKELRASINTQATAINAKVSNSYEGTTFGWELTSTSWKVKSGNTELFTVDRYGAYVKGEVVADSGSIGDLTIDSNGLSAYGIELNSNGLSCGWGSFSVDNSGYMTANNCEISGDIYAGRLFLNIGHNAEVYLNYIEDYGCWFLCANA